MRKARNTAPPRTVKDAARHKVKEKARQALAEQRANEPWNDHSEESALRQEMLREWKKRWEARAARASRSHPLTTWTTPWKQDYRKLYAGLTKAEAIALFLMRIEVIGLNAWLAAIRVPRKEAACECG